MGNTVNITVIHRRDGVWRYRVCVVDAEVCLDKARRLFRGTKGAVAVQIDGYWRFDSRDA